MLKTTSSGDDLLFSIHPKSAEWLNPTAAKFTSSQAIFWHLSERESKDSHQMSIKFQNHWKFRAPGSFSPARGFYSSLSEICWSQVFCLLCQIWAHTEEIYCCSSIANSFSNRYLLRKLLKFSSKCCPRNAAMLHAILTFKVVRVTSYSRFRRNTNTYWRKVHTANTVSQALVSLITLTMPASGLCQRQS